HRNHGYAKALIKYVEEKYSSYPCILIGTANSSLENITFYTRLGYRYSHRIENFFIDYYPKEIIENDMQATDLLYFKKCQNSFN
ncbi:GNAT family N-acetyltransferase, partial [Thomasclavelia sp.]